MTPSLAPSLSSMFASIVPPLLPPLVPPLFPPFWAGDDAAFPPGASERPGNSIFAGKSRSRILVIDDEERIADSVAEILSDRGYDAFAFYDGESAIQHARQQCPDLVLTDVIMPKLNGIETAIAITRICKHVRVVLFSGQAGTTDLMAKARAQGYDFDLLAKPVHPQQLLEKLAKLR
jgi:CheY-like chemotaxis protein